MWCFRALAYLLLLKMLCRPTSAVVDGRIARYGYPQPLFFVRFVRSDVPFGTWPLIQLVKITWIPNGELSVRCELSQEQKEVHNTLRTVPQDRVKEVDNYQMEGILKLCTQEHQSQHQLTSSSQHRRPVFIWPGTRWCGTGNVSSSYDDLGWYREEDKCCREHDLCDDILLAGGRKEDLENDSQYTRLNCDCDDKFWHCLREVNTLTSNAIGDFYFNLLKNKCYKKEHPIVGCITWHSKLLKTRCQEYKLDYTKPEKWQWFEAKVYSKP
ncbi:phospholipase A2-like [Centruroides vittatus]|uniref:phospholipase A2-like n=1 Tax=Centruroides vittatus TaxID=120091 RepID=UPI00350F77A0